MSDTLRTSFTMDRNLQKTLLEQMREVYPGPFSDFGSEDRSPSDIERAALVYLEEHGLCSSGISLFEHGNWGWAGEARITAAGLDFLEQDGGLTAILGVVTVRLHAETVRDMMIAKVEGSDLPAEKKTALRAAVGKMSSTAMTAATGDLVKMGLDHGPDAVHWLERLVSSFS